MFRRDLCFDFFFPVLSHLVRIGIYLQSLGLKYSSSAIRNICSCVDREYVVDLSQSVVMQYYKVYSTEKCFYLFSRSTLLSEEVCLVAADLWW